MITFIPSSFGIPFPSCLQIGKCAAELGRQRFISGDSGSAFPAAVVFQVPPAQDQQTVNWVLQGIRAPWGRGASGGRSSAGSQLGSKVLFNRSTSEFPQKRNFRWNISMKICFNNAHYQQQSIRLKFLRKKRSSYKEEEIVSSRQET